jgi:hypothetical protein
MDCNIGLVVMVKHLLVAGRREPQVFAPGRVANFV